MKYDLYISVTVVRKKHEVIKNQKRIEEEETIKERLYKLITEIVSEARYEQKNL